MSDQKPPPQPPPEREMNSRDRAIHAIGGGLQLLQCCGVLLLLSCLVMIGAFIWFLVTWPAPAGPG